MKNIRFVTIAIFILVVFPAHAKNNPWHGKYIYETSAGNNAADAPVIFEYTLKYSANKCEVQIEGYQTSESIICIANENNNELLISFISYNNGSTKNIYDVEVYPAGSNLFTLINKNGLKTKWDNLTPDGVEAKTGEYFIKKL